MNKAQIVTFTGSPFIEYDLLFIVFDVKIFLKIGILWLKQNKKFILIHVHY